MAEFERRVDWAEASTGRADPEAVLRGMNREIHGPTLEEAYADLRRQTRHPLERAPGARS
jgi:hypothetical protein